jgi:hypothetical protein
MKHTVIVAASLAFCAMLSAAPAVALNARTFVSGHGNDANPCNFSGPCRTFAAAYAKTAPAGEITVLDPAGYGPLTITTALSIVNDGVGEAGVILIAFGDAITINAGANDAVSLRGLTLDGGDFVGGNGIAFSAGQSLTIQNCVIRHFGIDGIHFAPNAAGNLTVSNTVVSDNGNVGINVIPTGSGAVKAVFNRVEANNNLTNGILAMGLSSTGTIKATVSDSVAAGNGNVGFYAYSGAGQAPTKLMVVRSVAANNATGLGASGLGASLRVANSTVTGNVGGWVANNSGVLLSYGDNYIDDNGSDETAPPSAVQK